MQMTHTEALAFFSVSGPLSNAVDSRNWMHLTARRVARTLSIGDGVPPC